MTEANSDSWKCEGENEDRRIEDLLPVCVLEAAAGLAAEEILEAPLGIFLYPIFQDSKCKFILARADP